jgi:hypothetical protein
MPNKAPGDTVFMQHVKMVLRSFLKFSTSSSMDVANLATTLNSGNPHPSS